jgi:hypothetical protein
MPKKPDIEKEEEFAEEEFGVEAPRKRAFLQAMRKHRGIITHACKAAGIARKTYYKWTKNDPALVEATKSISDFVLDDVENSAHDLINEGNPAMIIFYLKCKGKGRGYIEKQQIEHSTGDLTTLREAMSEVSPEDEKEY